MTGRPSSYKPEYAAQAEKLCKLGATDVELADFFAVGVRTIGRWQAEYDEFRQAIKLGKDLPDDRVERSLYHRAIGYTYDSVKVFKNKGEDAVKVSYREHIPPDTTACLAWLNNRRPERWRQAQRHEHTGKDGVPLQAVNISSLTNAQLDQLIDRIGAGLGLAASSRGAEVGEGTPAPEPDGSVH